MRKPTHIKASVGDIASRVLASGDPGRVKFIAENFLENARLVNDYRGLLVYSGYYKGIPVTIATHGIGGPSAAIVFEELIMLGARAIIRLGTCGSLTPSIKLGDIVIPIAAAYYPGNIYYQYYGELICGPSAPDFDILRLLVEMSSRSNTSYHVGPIVSSDAFYSESPGFARVWSERGILAVEMECSTLFTISRMRGVKSGAILVVVDSPLNYRKLDESILNEKIKVAASIALETLTNTRV
ncbi:MAG: purine-nucleoside phosphorylase [Acidilobaceae archaeon]